MTAPRTRRTVAVVALVVMLAGCARDAARPGTGSPTPSETSPVTSTTSPSPASTPPATASPSLLPALVEPGRPYTAAEIAAAMQASRRPGGVPDAIQTTMITEEVAGLVWTIDGRPWDALAAGGTCGPTGCRLDLVGVRDHAGGEDLWTFAVDPSSGAVEVVAAELGAVPDDIVTALDGRVRASAGDGRLDELVLASTRWLPPPEQDRFLLSYRAGDEERSCAIDIVFDAVTNRIVEEREEHC
jgi:hypothetical protein